jgi:hypothetical protein
VFEVTLLDDKVSCVYKILQGLALTKVLKRDVVQEIHRFMTIDVHGRLLLYTI